jgi:hypothetical protein
MTTWTVIPPDTDGSFWDDRGVWNDAEVWDDDGDYTVIPRDVREFTEA